ncbi:MAG: hypothetical protein JWM53_3801 [bacterium]|nr:hypothetical protein [bacterium]
MKYRGLLAGLIVTLAVTAGGCPELIDGIKRGVAECGGEAAGDIQQAIHLGQAPDGGDYVGFILGVVKEIGCVEPIVADEIRQHHAAQQACAIASAVDGGALPATCADKQAAPGEEQRARTVIAIARMAKTVTFDGGVK